MSEYKKTEAKGVINFVEETVAMHSGLFTVTGDCTYMYMLTVQPIGMSRNYINQYLKFVINKKFSLARLMKKN